MISKSLVGLLLSLAVTALTGCGGGGGGGGGAPAPAVPTAAISGMVSKGPINGGTVAVFAVRDGVIDTTAPIGQGKTDKNGNYAISLGSYSGPVLVEATGGSYTDEVTGAKVALKAPLRALRSVAAFKAYTTAVTPLTELAYKKVLGTGTVTAAAIDDANAKIAAFFTLNDIIATLPDAGTSGDDQKRYAAVLGSYSQYINNNKNPGELLDDALPRLLKQMGDELETRNGFSVQTVSGINAAMTDFSTSGKNQTGAGVTPLPVPTGALLKMKLDGVGPGSTTVIGALDVTLNFPKGVSVLADAVTGQTADGVVTPSGGGAGNGSVSFAKFTTASGAAPAQLHITMVNTAGFGTGEFVTIRVDRDPAASFPADNSAFTVSSCIAVGSDGSTIGGITATAAFVGIELK